jgi:hypothetical protein
MRAVVLGTAAALAAAATAPGSAAAEHWSDPGFVAAAAVTVHRGPDLVIRPMPDRGERWRDGRDYRGEYPGFVGGYYGGEWARWNNRSWEPSSYNDWWHDRPDRAFPRWVQGNGNCERQWWSGGVWRC